MASETHGRIRELVEQTRRVEILSVWVVMIGDTVLSTFVSRKYAENYRRRVVATINKKIGSNSESK